MYANNLRVLSLVVRCCHQQCKHALGLAEQLLVGWAFLQQHGQELGRVELKKTGKEQQHKMYVTQFIAKKTGEWK